MTDGVDDGGQAFPRPSMGDSGMTLRDYFAAKAIQTLMVTTEGSYSFLAQKAYNIADIMLAEREK